ncbi:MAG: hypothetical protein NUV84_00515 [Candidatus Uhrbacteria bacterium]|nr:hypothetical protein [Candidatus Uhrbacteria bacterium]
MTFFHRPSSPAEWVLRIAVAGEFLGHGAFALQGKEGWFKYFAPFGITDEQTMINMLLMVGVVDILLAIHVLVRPVRPLLLWMALWGLFTALLRWPIGGDPIWDFFERWANWGAPLALLLLMGWPKKAKDWWI